MLFDNRNNRRTLLRLLMLIAIYWLTALPASAQQVVASVPEIGFLVHEIGGDSVSVTVFAKGTEDPHFIEAKPSFIKAASRADLLVVVGLQLEISWTSVVFQGARNPDILPGGRGYLDLSTAIQPLEVPTVRVDRSMGDVHPFGNPHYLLDPLNGLKAAALIRDKLSELRPQQKAAFQSHYEDFAKRLCAKLVGEKLFEKYSVEDVPKLALLYEHGKLDSFLKSQGQEELLGGWLGAMLPHYGAKVVDDHNLWPYFAKRFGLKVIAHLEPKPGIQPTTQHLGEVVKLMHDEGVRVVLANAYYDPRHAQFVASQSGATVVSMAHQGSARPGTDDYISMVDYNVTQLVKALEKGT